jgi:DNA-nicking Smr family endonuclease
VDDWKERLQALKKELPRETRRSAPAPVLKAPEKPAEPPKLSPREAALDDEALFRAQMAGVAPLAAGPEIVPLDPPPRRPRPSDDDEVMGDLRRLVAGDEPFRFTDSDETIEGAVHDLDPRLRRKLMGGALSVEARLDLHGLTTLEARAAMDGFIEASVRQGRRVVCVVTGRGLHSKDGVPVLKERLKAWLTRSALALYVLAFASARPNDGGVGAVYVLLRKEKSTSERPDLTRE